MKKELIIILYKIDIQGLTHNQVKEQLCDLMQNYKLDKDKELINDYIIKQIWLPIRGENSDVKIIYPVAGILDAKIIKEIEDVVQEYPDSELTESLKKILSEIKPITYEKN